MAVDITSGITTAGTTGVGLQLQDPTTHTIAVSGVTTSGTTTAGSTTTTGVGLQLQDPTTHTIAVSGVTTSGTTTGGSTTTGAGLQLQDPTAYSYGTALKAALAAAVPIIFAGAAIIGVGLLSYAITKAALEPQA